MYISATAPLWHCWSVRMRSVAPLGVWILLIKRTPPPPPISAASYCRRITFFNTFFCVFLKALLEPFFFDFGANLDPILGRFGRHVGHFWGHCSMLF